MELQETPKYSRCGRLTREANRETRSEIFREFGRISCANKYRRPDVGRNMLILRIMLILVRVDVRVATLSANSLANLPPICRNRR